MGWTRVQRVLVPGILLTQIEFIKAARTSDRHYLIH
jgi:hypothetical protein